MPLGRKRWCLQPKQRTTYLANNFLGCVGSRVMCTAWERCQCMGWEENPVKSKMRLGNSTQGQRVFPPCAPLQTILVEKVWLGRPQRQDSWAWLLNVKLSFPEAVKTQDWQSVEGETEAKGAAQGHREQSSMQSCWHFNTRPWYLVPMLDPLSFPLPLHYVVNKACQALLSGSEAKVHMMIHVPTQELFPSPPSWKENGPIQAVVWELSLDPATSWARHLYKFTKSEHKGSVLFASEWLRSVSSILD